MMSIPSVDTNAQRRTSHLLLVVLVLALFGAAPVSADEGLAAAWVERGDLLAASGDYPGALEAYRTALRAEPGYVTAYLGIGQARLLSGAYSEALTTFKQILAGNPNEARAVRGVATARMGLKQYPQAIESWRRALQLNPTDTGAMIRAGMCYLALRRPVEALPSLEKACELAPDDADAFYHLGRAYLLLKRPVPAASALTTAVNLRASFYDAERLLLPLQVKSGLYISAQVFARDILSKAPNDKIALTNLALSYEGLGLPLDAARIYLTLAKVSPPKQAVALLFRVVDAAEHEGDRKLAREALEQAGAIDPTNPAIFARLGRSYEQAGDRDTALRYLRLAVTNSQARPEYLVEYGRALGPSATPRGHWRPSIAPSAGTPRTSTLGSRPRSFASRRGGWRRLTSTGRSSLPRSPRSANPAYRASACWSAWAAVARRWPRPRSCCAPDTTAIWP